MYKRQDLGRPIMQDAEVVLYKWEDEQGKHAFWHTSAHLLAEALQELYPGIDVYKRQGVYVPSSMALLSTCVWITHIGNTIRRTLVVTLMQ